MPDGFESPEQPCRPATALVVIGHYVMFRGQAEIGEYLTEPLLLGYSARCGRAAVLQHAGRKIDRARIMRLSVALGAADIDQQQRRIATLRIKIDNLQQERQGISGHGMLQR